MVACWLAHAPLNLQSMMLSASWLGEILNSSFFLNLEIKKFRAVRETNIKSRGGSIRLKNDSFVKVLEERNEMKAVLRYSSHRNKKCATSDWRNTICCLLCY
jgi:hypothetical protein